MEDEVKFPLATALILLLVGLSASTIGAITGIGGGILVKPIVDALGLLPVATASFLSGIMVLSMAGASLWRGRKHSVPLDMNRALALALGAALGGVTGKLLMDWVKEGFANPGALGVVQNTVLLAMAAGVFVYTLFKRRIRTHRLAHPLAALLCGLVLGLVSAFVGIGGGPMNLLALSFLFSMDAKGAARHSLFVILVSQAASLLLTFATGTVPPLDVWHLGLMAAGGVLGAVIGGKISQRLQAKGVDGVFLCLLAVICALCVYNILRFA